jgi:lycopene cyclase domain-containing protein
VDRYQYLLLMGACFVLTLPLEFVFEARIYRRARRTLIALVPALVVFTIWDVVAIARDHWSYSRRYTTGWNLPFDVPIEEIVFFLVIPLCGLLTFEASRRTLGR